MPGIILFNGLTFLFSAATECFIRAGRAPAGSGAPGPAAVLGDLRAGICYLKGQGGLAGMMLAGAAMNLTCGGFAGIAYAWCLEKGMSTGQYGLFLGADAWGAGAVCLAGAVATLLPALAFGANRTLRRILRGQGAE